MGIGRQSPNLDLFQTAGIVIMFPKSILFDLDDTLISAYGNPERAWVKVVTEYRHRLGMVSVETLAAQISRAAEAFWSDQRRHKIWRHKLGDARREIVRGVFAQFGLDERDLADELARRFSELREQEMFLFPGAIETLKGLGELGVPLGLITNGSGPVQRAKIERFGLGGFFQHIQIEGEHGFGKPEEQSYLHALGGLGVTPAEAWIVGDNLVWEVEAPQRLGIFSVWYDGVGKGLPMHTSVRPDRIICSLTELLE